MLTEFTVGKSYIVISANSTGLLVIGGNSRAIVP